MKKLNAMVISAIMMLAAVGTAFAWDIESMNKTIDQTNFMVNDNCSGTLIDDKNFYVLTANHCVTDQYETVEVEKIDENGVIKKEKVRRLKDGSVSQIDFDGAESIRTVTYKVRLVAVDKDVDLALLQVRSAKMPNTVAAKFACKAPVRGEPAYIVGNPRGVLYSNVVKGIVSSVQRTYEGIHFSNYSGADTKKPLMQISGGVIGGNSGGSVFNDRGEMIGVPVLANNYNEILAWAVPLGSIRTFLESNKIAAFEHCEGKKEAKVE